MTYIKLQFSCLIIILYITFLYVRQTTGKNRKNYCNPIFDLLLVVTPWAVVFDGATAWSVNHLLAVPDNLNLFFHGCFYFFNDLTMMVIFIYFWTITKGKPENKRTHFFISIPFLISLIFIFAFLPKVEYKIGFMTNHSAGVSPTACYVSVIFYFTWIFILSIKLRKTLETRKRISIFTMLSLTAIIFSIQIFNPEVLLTSLLPTFLLVGLYINIEDPAIQRIKRYNKDMVTSFATLVENRDDSTGGHVKRTQYYVSLLLDEMKKTGEYKEVLSKDYYDNLIMAAPMHDIGKIGTPDDILQKPGKLTDEEYEIMKQHASKGGALIIETFNDLDDPEFLKMAYEVARYHHEKYNGKGYPEGLAGRHIPLAARIMAIADVFDAISEKRCYRDALPLEECYKIIENGSGTDFDPELTQLFLKTVKDHPIHKIY